MTISFNRIPTTAGRVPGQYIEFDSSRAVSGLPAIQNRVLIIGQKLAAGTAPALTGKTIAAAKEAVAHFGRGSQLARMVAAYKRADPYSVVTAIGLDDAGGGTAGTQTITLTGPSTAAGTLALMIAGTAVPVAVATGSAATAIATAVAAAINALPDLPVTAAAAAAVVTLTARNKGTVGNSIDVRVNHATGDALPAGVTATVAVGVTGATDPDITTVWPVIGDQPYRSIVLGFSEAATLTAVKTELDDGWGPIRMLERIAYAARSGTQGALAAFGAAQNSELISILGIGKSPTWAPEAAAIYAAICGYYSAIDPARPLHTLTLTGLVAPKEADRFTRAQQDLLLQDGIATYAIAQDGTCSIQRAITTYQTDALGLDDVAYFDIETVLTLAYLRASVRVRIAQRYPRHKLADDDTRYGAGQAIVTPKLLRAELLALAREWEDGGLVENIDQFQTDLIVERNATDRNRVDALIPPDIVNQFRSFAAAVQFRL